MKTLKNNILWIFILALSITGCKKNIDKVELISPDNLYTFKLDVKDDFAYSIDWNNTTHYRKVGFRF
jgi:hypothetical protein